MKTLHAVLFLAFLGVSNSKLREEYLTAGNKECIKELGIETQIVLDSQQEDFFTTEGDAQLNEYTECSYRKANIIDENNQIDYDALKKLFAYYMQYLNKDIVDKEQVLNDTVQYCSGVEGNGFGDYLIKFSNCFVKQEYRGSLTPNLGYLFKTVTNYLL